MGDPDRLTSHDKTFDRTRGVLSFGLLWLLFSLRSSGTRSSLPGVSDGQRCKFDFMHLSVGSQLLPTPRRSHPAALDFDCSPAPAIT